MISLLQVDFIGGLGGSMMWGKNENVSIVIKLHLQLRKYGKTFNNIFEMRRCTL